MLNLTRSCFCLIVFFTLCACGDFGDSGNEDIDVLDNEIQVEQGLLRGSLDEKRDILQFLSIPYAAAPVGELRWRLPEAPESWIGVREATRPGDACIQGSLGTSAPVGQSEDCLFLNVTAPRSSGSGLRPVMVWLHGGDYDNGSGTQSPIDPVAMADFAEATDAVIVSVNARLGFLGFLALAPLAAESGVGSTGNYHHLDQVAALQWIRSNILAFNGDPTNVTLFGQASGADDVCLHLASPLSSGLFRGAILQSGGCLEDGLSPLQERLDQGARYLAYWACDQAEDALDCLRNKDPLELRDALFDAGKPTEALAADAESQRDFGYRAALDQYAFTATLDSALAASPANIPVLLGFNQNEYTLFRQHPDLENPTTFGEYRLAIAAYLPEYNNDDDLNTLTAVLYPLGQYDSYSDAFAELMADATVVCPSVRASDILSGGGHAVYLYHFTRVVDNELLLRRAVGTPGLDAPDLGVPHTAELAYLWNDTLMQAGEDPGTTVTAMRAYWAAFANQGVPIAEGETGWPLYDTLGARYLEIGETVVEAAGLKALECAFFNGS